MRIDFNSLIGTTDDKSPDTLGVVVFFNLSNVMVPRSILEQLCQNYSLVYTGANRETDSNAFKSATSAVKERRVVGPDIYKIYFRDNQQANGQLSRELVKEKLDARTNRYTKLANIIFDKETGQVDYTICEYDPIFIGRSYCDMAIDLYEKFKDCSGLSHIETLVNYFLEDMQAIKMDMHGRIYFIPRDHMAQEELFEEFIAELGQHNVNQNPLRVMGLPVMDSEKHRQQMSEQFIAHMQKTIEDYQEQIKKFLDNGSTSVRVRDRWILKIQQLKQQRAQYEAVLQNSFCSLNQEMENLELYSEEFTRRVARNDRAA